ncbi:hypothetical protein OH77DRAFT_188642 [Trametes cingulata]|nr:hypothetical protein OH77DRAFT_188642 [Trametes cingulata]
MYTGDFDLTVQHLVPAREQGEPSPSPQALLDSAAGLVACSCDKEKWYTPRKIDLSLFSTWVQLMLESCPIHRLLAQTRRGVQFSKDPPRHSESGDRQPRTVALKEWGVSPEEEESWTLGDLEEFDHGMLHSLFTGNPPLAEQPTLQESCVRASDAASMVEEEASPLLRQSTKRTRQDDSALSRGGKRIRLDEGPLYRALPPPHVHPAIMPPDEPWPAFTRSDFFNSTPSPIPPHTELSAEECISDPFARLAWIVPVRGTLPWEGATTASLNVEFLDSASPDDQEVVPQPPCRTSPSPSILWTGHAIRTFWGFLQQLRNAGNLGPLSLAYCNPPMPDDASPARQYSYVGSHKRDTSSLTPWGETSLSENCDSESPSPSLHRCVYIKVYHDARYTKVLRNILNAWAYKAGEQKFRLLKGATLALLDECGKGLLMC